ncbi:serine/threonine protein phosphatase [Pseudomonas sp. 1D4]|uniref:metallophosphoesterase n=1 Tax=Pseudomonas sp. 1D4 TaxID=1843691 RepID=UPI00084AD268|nr:metallophosphoesterase [Pseudomonas sp. 1D4]OEC43142.1 serine/threonine protein phosphatase [Pseudomonas sp. 1D4]
MSPVITLQPNTVGRDYVVGDIHGCFGLLRRLLAQVAFDESRDRLISTGDLVDRGPESELALEWLAKPWFFAVRGNHEQMVIDTASEVIESDMHLYNGGAWFLGLSRAEQQDYAVQLRDLPFAIEVPTGRGLVGIVHAECPLDDWSLFRQCLLRTSLIRDKEGQALLASVLWSRQRATAGWHDAVQGVAAVVVGHTPHNMVVQLGNTLYIDTGACFGGQLSALCLSDWSVHQVRASAGGGA